MSVFKSYDIRGIYPSQIDEQFAQRLGSAIIRFTKAKKVLIGYDSRTSNLKLFSALAKGITGSGANITHIGIVSRPMLNWVATKHKYPLAIMISASHNPKEYNGFKFLWKYRPLSYENGLDEVEKMLADVSQAKKKGKITSKDFIDEYSDYLRSRLHKKGLERLRIVADASNGAAGEIILKLFEKTPINTQVLFAEPDGSFPSHNPNPLDDNALIVLSRKVVQTKSDFGFIVDPDADRVRFVDEKGNIIENTYIQSLIVKSILSKRKGATIVHDLVSRKILSDTIRRYKGHEVVSKVGFAHIIENMIRHKAAYGCEMSGHNYFAEMDCMDSGLLMVVNVINMYVSSQKRMSSLIRPLDKYVDLGEINYKTTRDVDKVIILSKIKEHFASRKKRYNVKSIDESDGISVVASEFWLNIRPSNTEPLLRLRIEGKTRKRIERIRKEVEGFIVAR